MKATPLGIPEVILFEPKVFGDDRGFFFESFNQGKFEAAIGRHVTFVQDNHSRSVKNVLRGLHYQLQQPQGKLVRVVQGEVFDVAVDIRQSSPTFGQWVGEMLSAENKRQMWVPEGFAHGFVALSDSAECYTKPARAPERTLHRSIHIGSSTFDLRTGSSKDQQGKSEAGHFPMI
jgi:dTDP-4-dehydrorhamnose 3,5-epimerase